MTAKEVKEHLHNVCTLFDENFSLPRWVNRKILIPLAMPPAISLGATVSCQERTDEPRGPALAAARAELPSRDQPQGRSSESEEREDSHEAAPSPAVPVDPDALGVAQGYAYGAPFQRGGPDAGRVEVAARLNIESLDGDLSREIVRRNLRRHLNIFRYCYESQNRRGGQSSGSVRIRFVVLPTGRVTDVTILGSTLEAPEVEQCLSTRVGLMVFPSFEGSRVSVVASIHFGSEGS